MFLTPSKHNIIEILLTAAFGPWTCEADSENLKVHSNFILRQKTEFSGETAVNPALLVQNYTFRSRNTAASSKILVQINRKINLNLLDDDSIPPR